jgi:hypothetical protein
VRKCAGLFLSDVIETKCGRVCNNSNNQSDIISEEIQSKSKKQKSNKRKSELLNNNENQSVSDWSLSALHIILLLVDKKRNTVNKKLKIDEREVSSDYSNHGDFSSFVSNLIYSLIGSNLEHDVLMVYLL